MAFEIGQRVGDYEVVRMLGAGGMGHVYQVRNIISNRIEAMKVLLPDLVAEPDLAARFISEIRVLASFDHPNIAQLHTAFQVDNQLVMMMEFVEGLTLEQRARQGPIPQSEVINYMQQVLSALSYAHGRGVVHRDIKPANIMVTSHGVVKLMDFGIAKSHTEMDLTRPGTTMGSLYYMSPEQVQGGTVDARSDIYSVGIMMYELLAGRRPFEADSAYGILEQQCNIAPQAPVDVNQQLPRALSDLILCCLAKDPANRFQNAQAVSNALRQIAAGIDTSFKAPQVPFAPVVIPGRSAPAQAWRRTLPLLRCRASSGHRAAWITVGALAVLVVLACAAIGLPRLLHTSAKTKSDNDRASLAANPPTSPAPSSPSSGCAAATPDGVTAPDGAAAPVVPAPGIATPPDTPAGNSLPAPKKPSGGTPARSRSEGTPKPPRPPYQGGTQGNGQGRASSCQQPSRQCEPGLQIWGLRPKKWIRLGNRRRRSMPGPMLFLPVWKV